MERIVPLIKYKSPKLTLVIVTLAHIGVITLSLFSLHTNAMNFQDGGKEDGVINGFFVENYTPIQTTRVDNNDDIAQLLDSLNQQAKIDQIDQIQKDAEQAEQDAIQRAQKLALEEQLAQEKIEAEKKSQEAAKAAAALLKKQKEEALKQQQLEQKKIQEQKSEQDKLEAEKATKEAQSKAQAEQEAKSIQQALEEQRIKQASKAQAKAQALKQEALKKQAEEKAKAAAAKKKAESEALDNLFGGSTRQGSDNSQVQENNAFNKYIALVRSSIMRNFNIEPNLIGKTCKVSIRIASDGTISNPQVLSGDDQVCQAAIRAISNTPKISAPTASIAKRVANPTILFEPR